jgi:LPS O-antigen subunit length determinant protein (WzzB/FepE family)
MNNYKSSDEIELSELLSAIWNRKIFICLVTSFFSIVSILYALSLPNIYTSHALLKSAENSSSSSGLLSQYSGMASLAGISLGSSGSSDKSLEAIERIRSYTFFSKFFLPEISYQDLVAVKDWERSTNTLVYDEEVFDSNSTKWLGTVSPQDAYKTYNDMISIYQDKKTFFVSISIKHYSPNIAKEWVDLIVNKINSSMRDEEKVTTLKSIEFLNEQIQKVNFLEVRQSIASLQENQMKSLMLIESNSDYIFKTIDSSIIPEKKSEPKRSLIVIIATILGFFISLVVVLILHIMKKSK